jgi:hypothetical protein
MCPHSLSVGLQGNLDPLKESYLYLQCLEIHLYHYHFSQIFVCVFSPQARSQLQTYIETVNKLKTFDVLSLWKKKKQLIFYGAELVQLGVYFSTCFVQDSQSCQHNKKKGLEINLSNWSCRLGMLRQASNQTILL